MMEGMKVVDTIDPLSITELSPGKHILDMDRIWSDGSALRYREMQVIW